MKVFEKRRRGKSIEYIISGDCWICTSHSLNSAGYPQICVNYERTTVPRYSFQKHKGEIPVGSLVCHTCGNKRCINPEHLYAGDHSSNALDAIAKGNWRGLISKDDKKWVKELLNETDLTHEAIAFFTGVSQTTIHRIRYGKI